VTALGVLLWLAWGEVRDHQNGDLLRAATIDDAWMADYDHHVWIEGRGVGPRVSKDQVSSEQVLCHVRVGLDRNGALEWAWLEKPLSGCPEVHAQAVLSALDTWAFAPRGGSNMKKRSQVLHFRFQPGKRAGHRVATAWGPPELMRNPHLPDPPKDVVRGDRPVLCSADIALDERGDVTGVAFVECPESLQPLVRDAIVRRWRFWPAAIDGQTQASTYRAEINYYVRPGDG
jgi:hypothetical protein